MALTVKNGTKVEKVETDQSFQNENGSTTYVSAGSVILSSEDGKDKHVVPGDVYDAFFTEKAQDSAPPKR